MPSLRARLVLWLLVWLPLAASAQQVFVKNQPFEGRVVRDAAGLWVELRPLELVLDFESQPEAEGARINGRLVRTIRQGETTLVSLAQAASALGAVVREDPALGTIDVHLAVRPASGTAGLEVGATSTGPPPAAGERIATAAFEFSLPEGMQVSRDPRLIKAFLAGDGPAIETSFKFDAMVFYKGDPHFKKGAAVFSWLQREAPKGLANEHALLAYQLDLATVLLDEMGVELVNLPEVITNQGQRFVVGAGIGRRPPHHGMIILLRIDPKRKRFYQVLTTNIPQTDEQPTTDFLQFMATVTTR